MPTVAGGAEELAGGQADAQRHLGRHRMAVRLSADAVGAEVGARTHDQGLSSLRETVRNADLFGSRAANAKSRPPGRQVALGFRLQQAAPTRIAGAAATGGTYEKPCAASSASSEPSRSRRAWSIA